MILQSKFNIKKTKMFPMKRKPKEFLKHIKKYNKSISLKANLVKSCKSKKAIKIRINSILHMLPKLNKL